MNKPFIALIFMSSIGLLAQNKPYFGASVGMTVADQIWETGSAIDVSYLWPQLGLYVGANMEFYNEDVISLMTEFAFVQKGTRLEWAVTDPNEPAFNLGVIEENYRLNYLQWWAAIKFKANWESFQPYVLLGPRIDLQLSEEKAFPNSGVQHVSAIFGGIMGGGFQYQPQRKNFRIYVQGNYLMDFRDLHYTSGSDSNTALNIRNMAFAFSVGIQTRIIYDR